MDQFIVRVLIQTAILSLFVGSGARKLGYSGVVWCLMAFFAGPVFALALLPSLRNRALETVRRDERTRLTKELADARSRPGGDDRGVPVATLGDVRTVKG